MENLPLVSIALCTYNGEKYLQQQLDTLVNQSYQNIEIIAVDDCSKDNTFNILTAYADKYPNFSVYRNEKNIGFLKNFEKALMLCKGEFIAFCDQDDLWHPEKIAIQVAAIGDNQLIYHDSEFISENNEPLGKKMSDVFNLYRGDEPEVFLFNNCISGHAMLIRRDLLQHAFPLKENYYHDWWLAYVAANHGTIDFIPQCLVQYRQHEKSNTDLLKRAKVKKNNAENLSKTEKVRMEKRWLEICAEYPQNKNPEFIKNLLQLYSGRFKSFTSFRFGQLLMKHMSVLFFIQKKSPERKKREVRKFLWGFKGKNFWYTYIRPDREKILYF
jgi:glycosyltransferase involved in cell wall biosynthesis